MPSLQKYSPAFDHVWVHQVEEQWPFGRNKRQTATIIQERKESGKGLSLSLSLSLSLCLFSKIEIKETHPASPA